MPTLNLPTKSFTKIHNERSTASIEKRAASTLITSPVTDCYKTFDEFNTRIVKLKLPSGWDIKKRSATLTSIYCMDTKHIVPKYEILVDEELSYNILVYNWLLSKCNSLVSSYQSSIKNITLSSLISEISSTKICEGVKYKNDTNITHTVPILFSPDKNSSTPITQTEFSRPQQCLILSDSLKSTDKSKI